MSTEHLAAWGARGGKKRDFTTFYVKSVKNSKNNTEIMKISNFHEKCWNFDFRENDGKRYIYDFDPPQTFNFLVISMFWEMLYFTLNVQHM